MVRMLAFMPVAAPVWLSGTPAITMLATAARRNPNVAPSRASSATTIQARWLAVASRPKVQALTTRSPISSDLGPTRPRILPEAVPTTNDETDSGSIMNPEAVAPTPKP